MKKIKFILSLCILLGLGGWLYHTMKNSPLMKVEEITILGADPETHERLQKKIKLPSDNNFWHINVEEMAQIIRQDPWIETVEVKKHFPNTVTAEVTQRQPMAVVNRGQGQFGYIDSNNIIFEPAKKQDLAQYVSLSGKNILNDQKLREQSLAIIKALPETGIMSRDDVSEIQYQGEKGFQIVLAKTGIVVDLGKENIPLRLDRTRKVVQYLESKKIDALHLDADYGKKVLVKVRNHR